MLCSATMSDVVLVRFVRSLIVCCCVAIFLMLIGYGVIRWRVCASGPLMIEKAERALSRRENGRARELLKWLLWFDSQEQRALLIVGVSFNADQRFPEAISVLERISEESDAFEQGGIALASSLIFDGQLQRAESILKRQLARFPESRDAHNRLVRLYLKELREREAEISLLDRWHRYPDDLSVLPDLLELSAKTVTPHGRVGVLEAADKKYPDQAEVVLGLARGYSGMGMIESAQARFEAALKLRPDDPMTRVLAAEFYLDCGNLDRARSILSIESNFILDGSFIGERDDQYWFVRCRIAEQSGDVANAYANLQKALVLRPHFEPFVLMQATLLQRLGRFDEASQAALRAAELAEKRKQLLIASEKFNRDRPDPAHCLAIADLLDAMGDESQAAGWRRLSAAAILP